MGIFPVDKLWRRLCLQVQKGGKSILLAATMAFLGAALAMVPRSAEARIFVGNGYYCSLTFYYVGGTLQGYYLDNCIYDSPWSNPAPNPDGYYPYPENPIPSGGDPGGNDPSPCETGLVARGGVHPNLVPGPGPDGPGGGAGGGGVDRGARMVRKADFVRRPTPNPCLAIPVFRSVQMEKTCTQNVRI